MSQSLAQVYLHIVYSTKHRHPFLADEKLRNKTHAYLAGACKNLESPSLAIGGIADHVHILAVLSRNISISALVRELKRESSKWLKRDAPSLARFQWQSGYGAFSISPSHIEGLRKYIADQETHHRRESFQDEFRRLLKKYGVPYDENYVWD